MAQKIGGDACPSGVFSFHICIITPHRHASQRRLTQYYACLHADQHATARRGSRGSGVGAAPPLLTDSASAPRHRATRPVRIKLVTYR